MGLVNSTFTDTRKVVLSLTSHLPLLFVTTFKKIAVHMMPYPINSQFLRIYRVLKPAIKEGENLPPSMSRTPKSLSTAPI
jgi:hypothetical protein